MNLIGGYARRYRALGSDFGHFWLARALSIVGDQIVVVALAAYSFSLTRSAEVTSVVMMALTVPRLVSPFSGALADRLDARRAMLLLDLAQAVIVLGLMLADRNIPVLIGGAAIMTLASTVYLPAGRRSIASLTPDGHIADAYAAVGTAWNIGWAIGPAIGGLLLTLGGIRLALAFDLATYLCSAVLVRTLPMLRPSGAAAGGDQRLKAAEVWRTLQAGLSYLVSTRDLFVLALNRIILVGIGSIDTIALVTLTGRVFRTGAAGYSLLVSMAGTGMLCGSLLFAAFRRAGPPVLLGGGQAVVAMGFAATGLAPGQLPAMAAQWLAGLGNGAENVAADVLVQERVPEHVLGTITGTMMAAPYLGNLVAYASAPVIVGAIGPRSALVASAAGLLAVAVGLCLTLRRASPAPTAHNTTAGDTDRPEAITPCT